MIPIGLVMYSKIKLFTKYLRKWAMLTLNMYSRISLNILLIGHQKTIIPSERNSSTVLNENDRNTTYETSDGGGRYRGFNGEILLSCYWKTLYHAFKVIP